MTASGLTVGGIAPNFELTGVEASGEARVIRLSDYAGHWLMLVFYPRDFSFVCPTELTAFSGRLPDFRQRDCHILAVSIDSIESHVRWMQTAAEQGGIGPLQFPLASDLHGQVCRAYGAWNAARNVSNRGLYLIDPAGVIQYAVVHSLSVGRNPDEVLRVLDALYSGGVCPASWTAADGTLDVAGMLQSGRVLGHYRIESELGQGGFGTVLSAWDLQLERMVALKVLQRIGQSRHPLLAEARAAASVNHPNVCTIYAVEEMDGLPVIVMKHLSGRPLSARLAEGLVPGQVPVLAAGLAAGLAAAHEHNIVHGDLKPANVMVTDEGIPVLVDFGLARTRRIRDPRTLGGDPTASRLSPDMPLDGSLARTIRYEGPLERTGVEMEPMGLTGTPLYMSPEQANGEAPSTASDIFSCGLIYYEMLTGRRGLMGTGLLQVLQDLRDEGLAARLVEQVPLRYQDLVRSMLSAMPSDRPTASEVELAVKGLPVAIVPA